MGNSLCYKSGRKFRLMVNQIINQEYRADKTINDPLIKEFLEYLENGFDKLESVSSMVADEIKKTFQSSQQLKFTSVLNSFQLFVFIMQTSSKLNEGRIELGKIHGDFADIKMTVKRHTIFDKIGRKSKQIDAYFLVNYLSFQEKVFKAIKQILTKGYRSTQKKDYTNNHIELLRLILIFWREVFRIWTIFRLKKFSTVISDIFQMTIEKTVIFIDEVTILDEVSNVFKILPIKMFKKSSSSVLSFVETAFVRPEKDINKYSIQILECLSINILDKKKHQLFNFILDFYSRSNKKMVDYFISASSNVKELEEIILEFLIQKIRDDLGYFRLFVHLLKRCSENLINYSNLATINQIMVTAFGRKEIEKNDKFEFFRVFAIKCSENIQIGFFGFFTNLYAIIAHDFTSGELFLLAAKNLLASAIQLKDGETMNKKFLKIYFEVLSKDERYIELLPNFLEMSWPKRDMSGFDTTYTYLLYRLEPLVKSITIRASENQESLSLFSQYTKFLVFIQAYLNRNDTLIKSYIQLLTVGLKQVTSVLTMLFYYVVIYEFAKSYEVNNKILLIIQKYDDLLEKPQYKQAFELFESSSISQDKNVKAIFDELQTQKRRDEGFFNQAEVNEVVSLLEQSFGLNSKDMVLAKAQLQYIDASPSLHLIQHTPTDGNSELLSISNSIANYSTKNFEERQLINLRKQQELLNFQKQLL